MLLPRLLLCFAAAWSLGSAAVPAVTTPVSDLIALGSAELERGHADAAIAAFERAAALDPASGEVQRQLGDAYGVLAQNSGLFAGLRLARKVRAAYEQAVTLEPNNLAARESLLDFLLMAPAVLGGGTDKAGAQADAIAGLNPGRGHLARGRVLAAEKNFPEARRELAACLALAPANYAALYQVGRLAAISGEEVDSGVRALQQCLALPPTASAPGHDAAQWRLGNLREKQGDKAAARSAYEAALKINPGFKEAAESLRQLTRG